VIAPHCAGCDHLGELEDPRLREAGFKRCAKLPAWTYLSPELARCAFSPAQHTKMAEVAEELEPPQLRPDFKEHLSRPAFVLSRQSKLI
jgi:hypothetical protein